MENEKSQKCNTQSTLRSCSGSLTDLHPKGYGFFPASRIESTCLLSRTYFQKPQSPVDPRIPASPTYSLGSSPDLWEDAAAAAPLPLSDQQGAPSPRRTKFRVGVRPGRAGRRAATPLGLEARRGKSNGSSRLPARPGEGGRREGAAPREFSASRSFAPLLKEFSCPCPLL